jgi:hypothetical protein
MLGKGNVEFTPAVSRVGALEDGDSVALGTGYGGTIAAGAGDKVDLLAGYQRFEPRELDGGANFAGLGAKFSLSKDKAALVLPVTFMFGNDADVSQSIQVSPAAVFSMPLGKSATFNPAARVVWSNCEGCDVLFGASAGFSIPFSGGKAVLRPEIGALKNPGEDGLLWTFGVGLSLRTR